MKKMTGENRKKVAKTEFIWPKTDNLRDEKGRKYAQILDVKINITSMDGVLTAVDGFLGKKQKFSLISANPELLVMTDKDEKLKKIVNAADIVIPDGVGLRLARPGLTVVPGRKLFVELVKLAKTKKWKVYFLGGKGIPGVIPGPVLNNEGEAVGSDNTVEKINAIRPDLLFVGFGMPKQEKWIANNLAKLKIGGAVAVGGTFDYVFGRAKLPPESFEKLGLEWLWRLINEPWRLSRIANAVIVFPWKVFWYKFR